MSLNVGVGSGGARERGAPIHVDVGGTGALVREPSSRGARQRRVRCLGLHRALVPPGDPGVVDRVLDRAFWKRDGLVDARLPAPVVPLFPSLRSRGP